MIGGFSTLLGVLWTGTTIIPMLVRLWSDPIEVVDVFFLFMVIPLMVIPGILAVVFGIRLFLEMKDSSLKWVVGVFAVFLALFLSSRVSDLLPAILPEDLQSSVVLFVVSLVAILAYLHVVRWLFRHLTCEEHSLSSLVSRGVLVLMALQVWFLLSDIFDEYAPVQDGYTHVLKAPWGILSFIVPITVAYCSYRVLVYRLAKG